MSAPYYPSVEIKESVTRFGAIETSCPDLYRTPLKNKVIYEIDTLLVLREIWGESIMMSRSLTYKLVSGSCSDDEYRSLLRSYYRKFAAFSNYVNNVFLFGDRAIPKIVQITKPARELVDNYTIAVVSKAYDCGAKYLMRSHDYVYCSLPLTSKSTLGVEGVNVIC